MVTVWVWQRGYCFCCDREKTFRYDKNKGMAFLAKEPSYLTRYPEMFNRIALMDQSFNKQQKPSKAQVFFRNLNQMLNRLLY